MQESSATEPQVQLYEDCPAGAYEKLGPVSAEGTIQPKYDAGLGVPPEEVARHQLMRSLREHAASLGANAVVQLTWSQRREGSWALYRTVLAASGEAVRFEEPPSPELAVKVLSAQELQETERETISRSFDTGPLSLGFQWPFIGAFLGAFWGWTTSGYLERNQVAGVLGGALVGGILFGLGRWWGGIGAFLGWAAAMYFGHGRVESYAGREMMGRYQLLGFCLVGGLGTIVQLLLGWRRRGAPATSTPSEGPAEEQGQGGGG